VIQLNDKNFKEELKNRNLVLVDFYATWCGPCGMQAEVLDKMVRSRSLDFDIAKVNVDEAPNTSLEYGVDAIPTLMIFKGNTLIKRLVGFTGEEEILRAIQEVE